MTVPGDDSGENSQGGADQAQPEWGSPPPPAGFEPQPPPPPGYPAPVPGPPPGYPPTAPPPGYAPPGYGPPPGYPPPGYGPPGPLPGYPPGYDSPYPGGYPPPPGKTNTLAVASLVISLTGIVFAPLSVVGIVLGVVAFNQIKRSGEGGHGLAVAGVAVGAVTLALGFILMLSLMQ